jgi:hypothetical protein
MQPPDVRPNRLRLLARDCRGNAAFEFAFLAAPLVLFLFVIITAGQTVWLQNALNASVAEAARCATVNPTLCGSESQVQAYAANHAGAGFDGAIFALARISCGNQVSATYPLPLTMPFTTVSVTLSAQACFPV